MKSPKIVKISQSLAILVMIAFVLLSVYAIRKTSPIKPLSADAPLEEFSASRAFLHIEKICQFPHMVGTPQKDSVCTYIVNEIEKLGIEVDIQTTTVMEHDGFPVFANVTNIACRIKGKNNSKAVMVVGHYDTQPHTPGAADDGIAVGSMLEALRAIKKFQSLENDIIFLFTDAEEVGMLGAEAFAKEHRWMGDVGFILNLEARGNKGLPVAFEVNDENGWVIRELSKGVNNSFAGSMMYEVYRLMPNNTDFTVFKNKGFTGINVAIIEGVENYHSPTDKPENLSLASLQHTGNYIMEVAKHFGNISLTQTKAANLVYFNYFGSKLLYYPASLNWLLFAFIVILFLAFLILGFARKTLSIWKIALSLLASIVNILLVVGSVWLLNNLVLKIYPHYSIFGLSTFYNDEYYYLIYAIAAFLIFSTLFIFYLRFSNVYNFIASVFIIFIAFSAVILGKIPTASYITFVPLIFGLLSVNVLLLFNIEKSTSPWLYHLILLLGSIPMIFVLSPYIFLMFHIFGLSKPIVGVGFLIVLLLFSVPFLESPIFKLRKITLALLTMSILVISIIAHIQSKPSEQRPMHSNVVYGVLPDAGKAYWFSWNQKTDEWNAQFFNNAVVGNASEFYPWRNWSQLKADAEYKSYEQPEMLIQYDSVKTETRVVEYILKSKLEPVIIELIIPVERNIKSFAINGKRVCQLDDSYYSKKYGHHRFRLYSPSFGGDTVTFEYGGQSNLSFRMVEILHGLPNFNYIKPIPPSIIASSGFESSVTVIARTINL